VSPEGAPRIGTRQEISSRRQRFIWTNAEYDASDSTSPKESAAYYINSVGHGEPGRMVSETRLVKLGTLPATQIKVEYDGPSGKVVEEEVIAVRRNLYPKTLAIRLIRRRVLPMKTNAIATAVAIAVALSALGQATQPAPAPVKVLDAATAVILAEKALAKVYGKTQVESERPFTATLSDGIWHVVGTLHCKDKKGNVITNACVGGTAMADIRKNDGRVIHVGHTM
jgi:hypothetical protein